MAFQPSVDTGLPEWEFVSHRWMRTWLSRCSPRHDAPSSAHELVMALLADALMVLSSLLLVLRVAGLVAAAAAGLLDRLTELTGAAVRLVRAFSAARSELWRMHVRRTRGHLPRPDRSDRPGG